MKRITKLKTSADTLLPPGEGLKRVTSSQGQEQKLMLDAHRAAAALKEFQIRKKAAKKSTPTPKKSNPTTAKALSRRTPKKPEGA